MSRLQKKDMSFTFVQTNKDHQIALQKFVQHAISNHKSTLLDSERKLLDAILKGEYVNQKRTMRVTTIQKVVHIFGKEILDIEPYVKSTQFIEGALNLAIPFRQGMMLDRIEAIFSWKSRLTPLIGRENELKELLHWANNPSPLQARIIYGPGGIGKTRLAMELALLLRKEGWDAGIYNECKAKEICTSPNHVLMVIDYSERYHDETEYLLKSLSASELPKKRIRLLLLTRNINNLDLKTEQCLDIINQPLALKPINTKSDQWVLLQTAWNKLTHIENKSVAPPIRQSDFYVWLNKNPLHQTPLLILTLAYSYLFNDQSHQCFGKQLIQSLAKKEIVRLKQEAIAHNLPEDSLINIKTMACFTGALNAKQVEQLQRDTLDKINLPTYHQMSKTSEWIKTDHDYTGCLLPLEPDLIAAAFVSYVLNQNPINADGIIYAAITILNRGMASIFRLGSLFYDAEVILNDPWPQDVLNCFSAVEECKSNQKYIKVIEKLESHYYLKSNVDHFDKNLYLKTHHFKLKDGRNISYCEYGDPCGQPTLYCHSATGSRYELAMHHPLLKEKKIRFIAPDLPGYGHSDIKNNYHIDDWSKDIKELLNHLQIFNPCVIGQSSGGMFALSLAYYLQIKHAVLVSPIYENMTLKKNLIKKHLFSGWLTIERIMPGITTKFISLFFSMLHDKLDDRSINLFFFLYFTHKKDIRLFSDKKYFSTSMKSLKTTFEQSTLGVQRVFELWSIGWPFNIKNILCPIDIWHGDHDGFISHLSMTSFYEALANKRFFILKEETHALIFRQLNNILDSMIETIF